jgi:hypothetical protein
MKNLKKLLLATLLVAAAIASVPSTAEANPFCDSCAASGYTHCYSCCRCSGETNSACIQLCG